MAKFITFARNLTTYVVTAKLLLKSNSELNYKTQAMFFDKNETLYNSTVYRIMLLYKPIKYICVSYLRTHETSFVVFIMYNLDFV